MVAVRQPDYDAGLNLSRRVRRTPYSGKVEAHGVRGFSVVNHMLLPKAFGPNLEQAYWHLRREVQIWDVACQRQVEILGRDAARLVQWMTPRDIAKAEVGQCLYLPLTDETGGMVNDPVFLKLAENHFWLSIADSDVLLWAKGLALGAKLEVSVGEPDVSPLAVQGPKAEEVMARLFGESIRDLRFFRFAPFEFHGTRQLISRSGYSRQGGFEIYLNDASLGPALWDAIWEAGEQCYIAPGCPNLIERIEGGLLSYGNEMTRENNPLECGMAKLCRLDGGIDFLGREALQRVAHEGVQRMIRGVFFDDGPCPNCGEAWPVMAGGKKVGEVTSAAYSPRFERNVGLGMIEQGHWEPGQAVVVLSPDGKERPGEVTALPFRASED